MPVVIKGLGGVINSSGTKHNILKSIHHLDGVSSLPPTDLANHIKTAFLTPTGGFISHTHTPLRWRRLHKKRNSTRIGVVGL